MEFEDILVKVGGYGSYQKKLLLIFLFPAGILLPLYAMNILFMAVTPDHWCHDPGLAATNLSITERQKLIRPPSDPKCSMYDVNYREILLSSNWTMPADSKTKPCDKGWEYDTSDYDSTASTNWNMVCNDSYYASVVLTTADIGTVVGPPLYGGLSDRFGRKPVFFVALLITAVTGAVAVLMSDMMAFLVLKTIDALSMPSIFQLLYIIFLELAGPDKRSHMNAISNLSWTAGLCVMPLIAWLTHGWKTLGLTVAGISLVFFIYWRILPESPRWLVSRDRYDEAAAVLLDIAKENGATINPEELMSDLKKLGERVKKQKEEESKKKFSTHIFSYPNLRKHFFLLTLCWTADYSSYYGLQINVSNLSGNNYLNFFLLAVVEFPGLLSSWYFMEKIGRRWWSVSMLTLTGFACMLPSFISEEMTSVAIVASLLGKFGSSASYMVVYQQSSELYPTVIRSLGMGLNTTIAGIITVSIPYIVYLNKYGKFIPFLIISFVCFAAAIAASFLPETLNENLPQTLEDAEKFGKGQKFFSWTRRRSPSSQDENLQRTSQTQTDSNIEMEKL